MGEPSSVSVSVSDSASGSRRDDGRPVAWNRQMDSKPSAVSLKRTLFGLDDGMTVSLGTTESSFLPPKEPVLGGYLRDDFNSLLIGRVIAGTGVRVTREPEHCLDRKDGGGRTDKNLVSSLIDGSGANGEDADNNEARICRGGVVADPDGFSRVATVAYCIFCQRQAHWCEVQQ
jgi:hypothetical protein